MLLADTNGKDAYLVAQRSKELAVFKDFKAVSYSMDITNAQNIQGMVDLALKESARIDYCVNCAGVDEPCTFLSKNVY